MKQRIFPVVIVALLFFSCGSDKAKQTLSSGERFITNQVETVLHEDNLQYKKPIVLDSSGQVMIPVYLERGDDTASSLKFGSYSRSNRALIWNYLFYNTNTNESSLLTDKRLLFTSHTSPKLNSKIIKWSDDRDFIFFETLETDSNNDQSIDQQDQVGLYWSKINGEGFDKIDFGNETFRIIRECCICFQLCFLKR